MPQDLTATSAAARGKGRPRVAETAAPSLVELLNLIRADDPTTRQELERKSELGRAVVADRLTMLADLGLIDESETGDGHRRARAASGAAGGAAWPGAGGDAGPDRLGVGVADLAGNLLTEHHEEFELTAPPDMLAERLTTLSALVAGPSDLPCRALGHIAFGPRHRSAAAPTAGRFPDPNTPRPARMGGLSPGRNADPQLWCAGLDAVLGRHDDDGRTSCRGGAGRVLDAVRQDRAADRGGHRFRRAALPRGVGGDGADRGAARAHRATEPARWTPWPGRT